MPCVKYIHLQHDNDKLFDTNRKRSNMQIKLHAQKSQKIKIVAQNLASVSF